MANRYMKKCSTGLAIKEMHIKTTLRFHFTPVRMDIINNTSNKCWQRCSKTETLMQCKLLVGIQISINTMESSMEMPLKTKNRTAI
jgi:hypothetical protein